MQNKLDRQLIELDGTVLVTGAGGTIGSGLLNRIRATTIVALDISEYAIYRLQREIGNRDIHCVVGDASDSRVIDMLFNKYSFDYVFNAAAYKHVDTLEDENNTYSVVKNNILSVLALCKHIHGLKGLVHVSSDKAVNPTNSMGYTKLWCERIVQHYGKFLPAKIVRFGNVYKSSGSFIETLEWQMANDMSITITDSRMKRYFLTVDDAVTLIAHASLMKENGTYILEMGEEISIVDIVNQLNSKNLPVEYVGIRPGEKLSEELVYDHETLLNTLHPMVHRVEWDPIDMNTLIRDITIELNQGKICNQRINEIIETIMTL